MPMEPYEHLLEVERIEPATVIRFKRRTILENTAIEAIGEYLLRLSRDEGRKIFLLNFTGVESLTSAMLGKFAAIYRNLSDTGGQMAFCCVDPFLLEIFKVVQMPNLIPIHADEAQALQALSAGSNALTSPPNQS